MSIPSRVRTGLLIAGLAGVSIVGQCLAAQSAPSAPQLERVVIVMRHGVRPPTKSAATLAPLSDKAWPDSAAWGAAPGELTPHGAAAIKIFAASLRNIYADAGLLPSTGGLGDRVLLWADGSDQRTRATGEAFAQGLDAAAPPHAGSLAKDATDPLFDDLEAGKCSLDADAAEAAVKAAGPLETPEVTQGLARLQQIVAPDACTGGKGTCLAGSSKIAGSSEKVKIEGPIATGATLAENLMLEYENGLPNAQFGWGRASRADLDTVMAVHERTSYLTRRTPYIARRRAASLTGLILSVLDGRVRREGPPTLGPQARFVVLVGHDTNLANLAGVFDLDWKLPAQPDSTAPGTAIAFERWRDPASGAATVRVRVFYQEADAVRELAQVPARQVPVVPGICKASGGVCALDTFVAAIDKEVPATCR